MKKGLVAHGRRLHGGLQHQAGRRHLRGLPRGRVGAGLPEGPVRRGPERAVAAAPIPQWAGEPAKQINWGGSTFAVTARRRTPRLPPQVAEEVFGTEAAWKIGIEQGALFPLWKPILDSDYFKNLEYPFFGGQQINSDVFLNAAAGYEGFTFSPVPELRLRPADQVIYAMVQGCRTPRSRRSDTLASTLVTVRQGPGLHGHGRVSRRFVGRPAARPVGHPGPWRDHGHSTDGHRDRRGPHAHADARRSARSTPTGSAGAGCSSPRSPWSSSSSSSRRSGTRSG